MIRLDDISSQNGINIREKLDRAVVEHYMEVFDLLPPIVVFGDENFLGDGFHRVAAAEKLALTEIAAERHPGTRQDAEDYAVVSNSRRGIPLKKAERNAGILRLLAHGWTQQRIADAMGISESLIRNIADSAALRGAQPRVVRPSGSGRQAKEVKPLPPEVASELTDAHLRPIATLPVDAMEPVAVAVVKGDLNQRETHAVVDTVKAEGLDAGLAVAADLAVRRKVKKGMEDAVNNDATIAILDVHGTFLTLRQKFSPAEAALGIENEERDYYASEFTKVADWASAFSEALMDRRLKAL